MQKQLELLLVQPLDGKEKEKGKKVRNPNDQKVVKECNQFG